LPQPAPEHARRFVGVAKSGCFICRKTLYNRAKKILQIEPQIPKMGEVYNCLIADTTFIKEFGLMILKTPKLVVGFGWSETENKEGYE